MTLLNPSGLLLLLAIPLVVLLHLFRQERRRQEVSSLFLWRQVSNQQSRRIRPRLFRNLNLLLQVFAVVAASLAIAQPTVHGGMVTGAPRMVVIVDTSASMRTAEGQVTRLELAKNRAREVVGRSRRDTEILIATVGPVPSIVQGFTSDRTRLYEVIRAIEPQDGAGDLEGAAGMIRALGSMRETDVVLVTDGAFSPPDDLVLPGRFRTELVGSALPNRGITAFRLRRRFDGSALEAYVEVANFAPEAVNIALELSVDGRVFSRGDVTVKPEQVRPIALDLPGISGSVYRARLDGNEDALPVDDVAFSVASSIRPLRVQLVTAGNYFLESMLAVYPDVLLTVTPVPDLSAGADLYVLDAVDVPAGLTGSVLAFATSVPGGPFEPEGYVPVNRVPTVNATHPIAANLDLSDVAITRALDGTLAGRSVVVASAGDVPLIYASSSDARRLVGFTFSLADSDLGLRSSFPILINNVISWLAPSPQDTAIAAVSAGTTVPLLVTPGSPVSITYPSGRVSEYRLRENTLYFRDTVEAGVYTVRGPGFSDQFAVMLSSQEESDLRPRYSVAPVEERGLSESGEAGSPIWQWAVVLGLLLLAADWVVWVRRT